MTYCHLLHVYNRKVFPWHFVYLIAVHSTHSIYVDQGTMYCDVDTACLHASQHEQHIQHYINQIILFNIFLQMQVLFCLHNTCRDHMMTSWHGDSFPCYWSFVKGIHPWPVRPEQNGQCFTVKWGLGPISQTIFLSWIKFHGNFILLSSKL